MTEYIAILYVIVWVQGKGSGLWDILQDIADVTEFSHNYNQSHTITDTCVWNENWSVNGINIISHSTQ